MSDCIGGVISGLLNLHEKVKSDPKLRDALAACLAEHPDFGLPYKGTTKEKEFLVEAINDWEFKNRRIAELGRAITRQHNKIQELTISRNQRDQEIRDECNVALQNTRVQRDELYEKLVLATKDPVELEALRAQEPCYKRTNWANEAYLLKENERLLDLLAKEKKKSEKLAIRYAMDYNLVNGREEDEDLFSMESSCRQSDLKTMHDRVQSQIRSFHSKEMARIMEQGPSMAVMEGIAAAITVQQAEPRKREEELEKKLKEKNERIKQLEAINNAMTVQNSEMEQLRAQLAQMEVSKSQKRRKVAKSSESEPKNSGAEDSDGWSHVEGESDDSYDRL